MIRRAIHFGPDPRHVGGMGSVIRILVSESLGADKVMSAPTWVPDSKIRSTMWTLLAALRILSARHDTVAHVHLSERGSFLREGALVRLASLRRLTTVVTVHGADFEPFAQRRPRLARFGLGAATAITVLSEQHRTLVLRLMPDARVVVMPNPMPLDLSAAPASECGEHVLFAGEVGTRKGADILLSAWPNVVAQRPYARCTIVGPATGMKIEPADGVKALGPLPPSAVKQLIREARVVALPSRSEALPMILTEAMAAARPFVSTPIGGITSLAAGGIIVPVEDSDALANALIGLLRDPERAERLGVTGQRYCGDHMAPGVIDARLREIYARRTP
jgi:glycosyltransferase involved in cell wall biosynthesis